MFSGEQDKQMNAYAAVVAGILCFLPLFTTTAQAQKTDTSPKAVPIRPDLSQPDKAIHAFVHGINHADANLMLFCVVGAKPSEFSASLFKESKGGVPRFTTTIVKVTTKGDDAQVTFSLSFVLFPPPPGKVSYPPPVVETVSLHRQNSGWLIQPLERSAYHPGQKGYVSEVSTLLAYPDIYLSLRAKANAEASLGNIKLISFAALVFASAHNDAFAFSSADFKRSLMPILKDEKIWTSPLDSPGKQSYLFNKNLLGVSLSKIKKPGEVVMVYEGEHRKPLMCYEGKASIGFADGHCKLLTADEVKKLRWLPTPP